MASLAFLRSTLAAAAVAAATLGGGAAAQTYPDGPVRIISMHPPGSVTDVLARPLAQRMNASLSQPVIVENRPGANGNQQILLRIHRTFSPVDPVLCLALGVATLGLS